jgi:para-nitrobenzyl esterase
VFSNADNKVLYIGDPVTVGAVPNIDSLKILDAVYTTVRGKAFAAR